MADTVICPLEPEELLADFYALLGELECGRSFAPDDPEHRRWLSRLVAGRAMLGVQSFGLYTSAGDPVGIIVAAFDQGPPGSTSFGHKVELLDLGLLPTFRGQGLGRLLVQHVERIASHEGYHCLIVATYAKQVAAVTFYVREGFVPVATLPDVHGPGDEGMVYLRRFVARAG